MLHYLVIYDISEDKIRTQIARLLEQAGGQRIQKSVFAFRLERSQKESLKQKIRTIRYNYYQQWQKGDNVLIFPFEPDQLRQTEAIGDNPEFSTFANPPHTHFF